MNREKECHESYGMMQISRSQYSGNVSLFGSSIQHNNVIKLRISKGDVTRSLNTDHYHASLLSEDTFVEVEMSYSQFAEAVTSLNMGSGVPVTIRQQGEQRFERPLFIDKETQYKSEYLEKAERLLEEINDNQQVIETLLEQKKPLNKSEKDEILSSISQVQRTIASSMPFLQKCFMEQMDKISQESKAEVESFIQTKMNQIAISAIGENNANQLTSSEMTEEDEQEQEQGFGMEMG